jgi:hypothetical protein
MKAILFASIFAPAVAFGSAGSGSTQESAQQPAGPSARTPDEVVNTLAAKLNLTGDQQAKIQPIIADRHHEWRN